MDTWILINKIHGKIRFQILCAIGNLKIWPWFLKR